MPKRTKRSFASVVVVAPLTLVFAMGCGSSSGTGGNQGCYELTGPVDSKLCAYTFNRTTVTCPSHYTMGSCPSADSRGHALIGCCVTSTGTGGGVTDITAGCYYDSTTADSAKMGCGKEWSTTAP